MTARWSSVVLLWALLAACASPRGVRLETGQGEAWEHRPPTSGRAVRLGEGAFEEALERWVLEEPLALRTSREDWLASAAPGGGARTRWQRLMGGNYKGWCKPGERRPDCLSMLDDVMALGEREKLGMGLLLSLEPLKQSIARAVEETLAPRLFYAAISTVLVGWAVLAANPEPVFTKAAAVISALMVVYLGVEVFLEVVEASRELKRATDRATTLEELERAAERFAKRVGPEVARVLVLAVTVATCQGLAGGAAWLASRASMLPSFPEAAAVGASQVGLRLELVGQVGAVAVVEGTVVIRLPATAVFMAAAGGGTAGLGASGQVHHVISKRIAEKLANHPTLQGHYTERDPRFVTRAADKNAHNGYQHWHRNVDAEVIEWLETYRKATPAQFEAFLRKIYSRPAMRARFPHGF